MLDEVIGDGGAVASLGVAGAVIGFADRRRFSARWLLVAVALVLANDALLTNGYGLAPNLLPDARWNWQGKLLALLFTLAVASLPAIGWRRSGLTFRQAPGSLARAVPVALVYMLLPITLAFVFPGGPPTGEEVAFQLTMPGLEEEAFYRGVLLLALDRAFTRRVPALGVEWGWGALLSSALFGLAHAFSFIDGRFVLDPLTMALTALPSLVAVWVRLRTGSIVLPVLMHNAGNSIGFLL